MTIARLTLHAACGYPSWDPQQFVDQDWKSRYICLAVKGDVEALERAYVWLNGHKYNHENYHLIVQRFQRWAAAKVRELGIENPVLAPIPNSSTTPDTGDYATKSLAQGIQAAIGASAVVFDGLRFKNAMPSARKGGVRNPRILLANMVVTSPLPAGQIVLIDDVCTSGGHLLAAQHLIGEKRVTCAITCGRTVHESLPDMLNVPAEVLTTDW